MIFNLVKYIGRYLLIMHCKNQKYLVNSKHSRTGWFCFVSDTRGCKSIVHFIVTNASSLISI